MTNLSSEEVNLLRHNARCVVRELSLLNDAYFDIDVTLAERHLLIELSTCLYPTVGDIAERLLLDKSTASRLIAKAVKKGYVKYSTDENDKRKRFLQLTEKGKKILNTFEPIAFDQTKNALLTLSPEEVKTVYHGIELYAKGLKNSRLRNKVSISPIAPQDNAGLAHLLSETHQEKHALPIDLTNLFETYQEKGFAYFVMKMESKIIGGAGISPHPTEVQSCQLERITIVPHMQDLGFEKILIDSCLHEAKKLHYAACYINITLEHLLSKEIFQNLGFQSSKSTSLLWKAC